MQQYLDLLNAIMHQGEDQPNRTGVNTRAIFGYQMRINLDDGFPLLTTKFVPFRLIMHEMLWFLSGSNRIDYLTENDVHIWDAWATPEQCARFGRPPGDLGPIYGFQWRRFGESGSEHSVAHIEGVDQIARLVRDLKENLYSRRHILTGWDPRTADTVALPPCHTMSQFHVSNDGRLSCQLYQRSADVFLGVPFNIASYALLTNMLASVCGLKLGTFVHTFGNVHIYHNHFEQVFTQLERSPLKQPRLELTMGKEDMDHWTPEDFQLLNYNYHPAIPAPVAI